MTFTRGAIVAGLAILGLGVALLMGVTTSPPDIGGTWFRERRLGGDAVVQILTERAPDGALRIAERGFQDCRVRGLVTRTGRWRRDGNAYVATVGPAEGVPRLAGEADSVEARFEIEWLTESTVRFRHQESGALISELRVPLGFEFPPPAGCPEPPPGPPPLRG